MTGSVNWCDLVLKGEGIALLYSAIAVVKSLPTACTSIK